MNAALAQRQIALAGIALLAGILALALGSRQTGTPGRALPQPVGPLETALASAHGPNFSRPHVSCGHVVGPTSLGIADSILPCNALIYLLYGDQKALTQVIARGAASSVARFEVSPALARKLDLSGTAEVRWQFAR